MLEQIKVLKYYFYYKYCLSLGGRKALMRRQAWRMRRHLRYVAKYSEIYRGKRRLRDYPIVDKEFMMSHFQELNTVGIGKEEAEEFAIRAERERNFVPKLRGVTVGLSSGTSGRRGIFLVSDEERIRWAGYILAKFLPGWILEKYSIGFFMRADSNLYQSIGSKRIAFHFFDIYQDMEKHRKRLEEICPDILVGQPSVLLEIAKDIEKGRLRIRPKVVISIAEVLEREDEKRLKRIFGLKIIHQVYQCTEGFLASTCSCGTLHLNEDIVHIEKERLDKNRFIPIVTDFERHTQPIIRYRLNDILVEKRGRCRCNSPCAALERIEGREDDIFLFEGKDGREKKVFPDFIRRCMLFAGNGADGESYWEDYENAACDYRVVQEENGEITVYGDLTERGKEQVREELNKLAEDQGFVVPQVVFERYGYEIGKKMKRVERKRRLCL